jgi:hypothetical protein
MQSQNLMPKPQSKARSLLYDRDFYAWTQQQVALIREGRWEEIDRVNLLEEIESLGKQQRQELRNRLGVLMGHLLKWQYQPQNRSCSWLSTIRLQRLEIVDLLDDNPSLKSYLDDVIDRAYLKGLAIAIDGTNLPDRIFPQSCEYSLNPIDLENWSYGWSLSFQRYGPDPRFFQKTWDLIVSRGPKPRKV